MHKLGGLLIAILLVACGSGKADLDKERFQVPGGGKKIVFLPTYQ